MCILNHPVGGTAQLGLTLGVSGEGEGLTPGRFGECRSRVGKLPLPVGRPALQEEWWVGGSGGGRLTITMGSSCPWSCRAEQLFPESPQTPNKHNVDRDQTCPTYFSQVDLLMSLHPTRNYSLRFLLTWEECQEQQTRASPNTSVVDFFFISFKWNHFCIYLFEPYFCTHQCITEISKFTGMDLNLWNEVQKNSKEVPQFI